jgi:hypothetical protein
MFWRRVSLDAEHEECHEAVEEKLEKARAKQDA